MAEEKNGTEAAAEAPQGPRMQIMSQYIRDLSFENVAAQKGTATDASPDINVQVNLDANKKNTDKVFEVILTLKVEATASKKPIFLLELEYGGLFTIDNIPDDQMHPFLMIECPRMLFPFVRRIVSDVTRDGGYPPLNVDNIDFMALYRNEIARRAQASGQKPN